MKNLENLVSTVEAVSGDLMEMREWLECVNAGGFIDYDGFGFVSDGVEVLTIPIYPSDTTNIMHWQLFSSFSHIVWFNK